MIRKELPTSTPKMQHIYHEKMQQNKQFFFLSQTLVVIAQTLATNYKSIKVPTIFKAAEIV